MHLPENWKTARFIVGSHAFLRDKECCGTTKVVPKLP
jgi:hypothetical protein